MPDTDKKPDPREPKNESKGKENKKKHKGRELVECLLVAGILALTIRQFGFQIFKIPTRSMEPALYGNEDYGDRVVAMMWYNRGKLGLGLGEVRRWQVLVFNHKDHKGTPTNYIKRVAGLPGEYIEIRDGDVWAGASEKDLQIARKPRGLQEDLWIKLCDLDFSDPRRLPYYWDATPKESAEIKDGKLLLRSTPEKMSLLRWRHERGIDNRFIRLTVKRVCCRNKIKSKDGKERICGREFKAVFDTARPMVFCPNPKCKNPIWGVYDNGSQAMLVRDTPDPKTRLVSNYWTGHEDDGTEVPDIRLKLDFQVLEGTGKLEAVLTCRSERYGLVVPLEGRESKVELYREVRPGKREVVARKTLTLTAGSAHRLELTNVDAEVRAEIDGVEIGTHQYVPPYPGKSDVDIAVSGSLRLAADNLKLYRDIYYGHRGGQMREGSEGENRSWIELGKDQYFFLGDNSLASSDGRVFEPKKEKDIVARGLFVAWPLSRMHWIK